MAKYLQNETLIDPASDRPLTALDGDRTINLDTARAVRDFVKSIFIVKKDGWNYHSDLKTSDRILRACKKAGDGDGTVLELDQGDYDWLTKKLEEMGAQIFGAHTVTVREALDREADKETVLARRVKKAERRGHRHDDAVPLNQIPVEATVSEVNRG